MDYQERQAQAMLGKHTTYHKESCPLATQDVHENTKNRDWTIDNFGYGPMNPDYPNEEFWEKKAEIKPDPKNNPDLGKGKFDKQRVTYRPEDNT